MSGIVDRRFDAVRDAFAENFAVHGELGAAVCVVVDGRTVVDLWGGFRDLGSTLPWQGDTLVNVFSVGKAFVAATFARLVGRGLVDYDAPVAAYWPEFAAGDKGAVTIRQVLSHASGLPALRRRMEPGAMLHPRAMHEALAREVPWWAPGTAHGYHVNTFGFLAGAVVERVTGRTLGTYLREELCGPIDADVHVGLRADDLARVAQFRWPIDPPPEVEPEGLVGMDLMRYNAYWNPSGLSGAGVVNTRAWRQAEIPSTNTHATARGVARMFEVLGACGRAGDHDIVPGAALTEAVAEETVGHDLVLERPSRFGLGFQLTLPERPIGRSPRGFGHFGAGGSLGYCDPEDALAFAYVTNDMGPRWQNPRNQGLTAAIHDSLG